MQVELLRDIINSALEYGNEELSFGFIATYSESYEDCYPLFLAIFDNVFIEEIENDECTIKRSEKGFLVTDCCGKKDIFTYDEIFLYTNFWKKLDQENPRPDGNEHICNILQTAHCVLKKKE